MTVQKIAISLPRHLVVKAKNAVQRGQAASLSAYVAKAVEQRESRESLRQMFDEWLDQTGGPITEAEARRIDAILSGQASSGVDGPVTK